MPPLPRSSSCPRGQPSGSQLPPRTHRAVHGGAGIPQRCRQLPALLLFSQCWLRLLSWCQPLASPTTPPQHPSPQGLPSQAKHRGLAGGRISSTSILLTAWPLSPPQHRETGMLGPPGLSSQPKAGIAPGVHAMMGIYPAENTQGMGQQHIPSKGPGGNECSVKTLLHVCVH